MSENKITRGTVSQNGLIDIELIQTGTELEIKLWNTLTFMDDKGTPLQHRMLVIHLPLSKWWSIVRMLDNHAIGVVRLIDYRKCPNPFFPRLRQAINLILNRN